MVAVLVPNQTPTITKTSTATTTAAKAAPYLFVLPSVMRILFVFCSNLHRIYIATTTTNASDVNTTTTTAAAAAEATGNYLF